MNGTFFCNKCGAQNAAGAQFCNRCGAPTGPAPGAVPTPLGSPSAASPYVAPSYAASATSYQAVAPVAVGYGGFWIRVVAAIIDAIILRVVVAPVGMIFGGLRLAGMMSGIPHVGLHLLGGGVTFILLIFGSWLYEALMESSSYQATLGKMIFGMKVTDLNGNRISFERATGRHFAKWLSGMILGIGYIMVGFTERKQGLHDLLAGTLVRRM
ncbi:MAG TPA: RDD family protein [Terriglobales bacterium]|nr:RDD family protein [Terriglobales bacterium]